MTHSSFDLACLFSAVEQKRSEQELSWAAVSRSVGIAASTMRRYATADDAEADGVLALIRWVEATPGAIRQRVAAERCDYLPS